MVRKQIKAGASPFPDKAQILDYIRSQDGKVGKREIARAFAIKGSDKIALKALLKELAEDGAIAKRGKKLARPGTLPAVSVLDIRSRDGEGDLIAQPNDWVEEDNGPAPHIVIQQDRKARGVAPQVGVGDRILARLEQQSDLTPEGRIVYHARIIKRLAQTASRTLGVFRAMPGGRGRIEPVDRKALREFTVEAHETGDAKPGDLVSISVQQRGRHGVPQARIVEVHGPVGNEKTISRIAIQAHGIPDTFPKEALAEAEVAKPVRLSGKLEDLRDVPLITIDPADARDHDDAVWAGPDEDGGNPGGVVVIVAIADVAHYVRGGSALDREARQRGNSVYFPDQVVPMLPERISNDLCSLREGEDRPVMAVRMVFGADGRKKGHKFIRALIRSAAKLSYAQAQAAIDGQSDDKTGPLLEPVLKPLWHAYEVLSRGRDAREPLDLDLPERKVLLKKDGSVDRIVVPPRLDAHRLIEEFMIQANVAAAETLEAKKSPLLYRVHDAPSKIKLDALHDFLATLELKIPKAGNLRPSHFNKLLARVEDTEFDTLVNEVVLRTQSQAEYAVANLGHFGLNLRRYAHFTSPIRRYADLIVHRGLIRALGLGDDGLSDDTIGNLEEIAAQISAAERRAMAAERDTLDRLIAHHLTGKVGAAFKATISGVTRSGLFVRLADTGADGFIPASKLGEDYFRFDERRHALIGDRSGEMHRIGDHVEVRLVEAAPLAGALRFDLLSEGRYVSERAGSSARDRRGKSRPGGRTPPRKAPRGKAGKPRPPRKKR
mgnify:CR=1 FL=1